MSNAALRLAADHGARIEPVLLPAPVRFLGDGDPLSELAADGWREHRARYGARPSCRPHELDLRATVHAAGVTGRGGGHVPAALKWSAVDRPDTVVANAAESEPGSRKDAALLQLRPHLVLDGLACVAEALGARRTVIWLHAGAGAARAAVEDALAERRAARHGERPVLVLDAPNHYLSGESSAVAHGVSGGPALPVFRRRHGDPVGGQRTLVHNVETLARIAVAARDIAGTATVLVSVRDAQAITVLELPVTATIGDAVGTVLGDADVQAVLVGGYGGSWLPYEGFAGTPLYEPELRAAGASLGAGVLEPLGVRECGVTRTARIARYLADASARQCGPCLFGLEAVADALASLASGRRSRREDVRVQRFLAQIEGRGACHHPDGAVRMVASALQVFDADVAAHRRGRCLHPGAGAHRG